MNTKQLEREINQIFEKIVLNEPVANHIANGVNPQYRLSSKNLFRYLIFRCHDLRTFHDHLSDLGISSLRTGEGYVYTNLFNVLRLLNLLQEKSWNKTYHIEAIGYQRSMNLLRKHANALFNEGRKEHFTEIMVTLPNEAADDIDLIRNLATEGMEIARINLSHGDLEIWDKMIANIKQVKKETGLKIKVYMDLSGPKIRTSKIQIYAKKGKIREFVKLKVGDHLVLTKRETTGRQSLYGNKNELIQTAEVGVLLPQIIDDLKINDTVYFDDGMFKAVVISKNTNDAELVIVKAYKAKLSANKGINLPSTILNLPSLTERDIELLPFICAHADIVGYSFVRKPEDVVKLYDQLAKIKDHNIGVIFKIENQEAFENLPLILFEAMKRSKIGIMIARGDLAVEIGFERISEVQNQILWLCEAAHVPVIWATQVLENLAKTGVATRAEVSDVSLSAQAECVMLNKGPYILDAVRTLKNILIKMEAHSFKKKSALRPLNVAKIALEKLHVE
jgi:pyruvate kinase